MIEMNGLSLSENPKSPKECIKQALNTISVFKKKKKKKNKRSRLKQATVTIEIHNNILNTLNNMGSDMIEFAKKHHEE